MQWPSIRRLVLLAAIGLSTPPLSLASAVIQLRQADFEAHLQKSPQLTLVNFCVVGAPLSKIICETPFELPQICSQFSSLHSHGYSRANITKNSEPCQKLATELEATADALQKKDISVVEIDCSEKDGVLCKNLNIMSYPAMRICRGPDNCERYREKRTAEFMTSYLIRQTLPQVSNVNAENFKELTSLGVTTLIAYIPEEEVSYRDAFTSIASSHRGETIFGLTTDARLLTPPAKEKDATSPFVMLYNPLDHLPAVSKKAFSKREVAKWLESASTPLIGKFSLETYYEYNEAGLPLIHIFSTSAAERQALAETLQPVAEKYRGVLNFATIDAAQFGFFAPTLGVDPQQYPAVVIEDLVTGESEVFDQSREINAADVGKFVAAYVRSRQRGAYETGVRDEL